MPSRSAQPPAEHLELSDPERVLVSAMQVVLLRQAAHAGGDKRGAARAAQLEVGVQQVRDDLARCAGTGWADALAEELAQTDPEMRAAAVGNIVADPGPRPTARSRALLVLIDVCLFAADGVRWDAGRRRRALAELTATMPVLTAADLERVLDELSAARRVLARRQTRWGRVAAASAAGVGLGVVTMGAATPAIAAAVAGGGLTGAAATSAGLAALGGGSLAAGGFGVAGGTILLTGVGAVSGLGAGAAGSWLSGWSAGQVASEALRLAVATRLVVLEEERDEETAKRVVMAMQERLDDVTAKLDVLTRRLREANATASRLTEENRRLRARLRAERGEARQIGAALETALERIQDTGHDVGPRAIGGNGSTD